MVVSTRRKNEMIDQNIFSLLAIIDLNGYRIEDA